MDTVNSVALNDADIARLPLKEQTLLKYVKQLTKEPAKMNDALTQEMRTVGWSDEEIFEASFITSLFAFFNRMAESYGLGFEAPWRPPAGVKWPAEEPPPPAPKPAAKPAPKPAKPATHKPKKR